MTEHQHKPHGACLIIQRFISQPRVTAFFSCFIPYLDRLSFRITQGRYSLSGFVTGWPVVIVITTGAKSGLKRISPLIGIPDGNRVILIASNFGKIKNPDWYYNIKANPNVQLKINGHTAAYTARQATEEERQVYWYMAKDIYLGFPLYRKRAGERRIPIIVLTPLEE